MIYAILKSDELNIDSTAYLFMNYKDFHRATFSPALEVEAAIELGNLKGKTYQERKAAIQEKAIDFSNSTAPGLDLYELSIISAYFYKYGKRYGLMTEFKENCIC